MPFRSLFGDTIFISSTPSKISVSWFSPIPDSDNLSIKYDYYITHTDLSASTDTSIIPARFESVIDARARYYSFMLRSDLQNAQFANKEYEDGVKRMRVELINRKNYVRAV